ncbi:MAG: DUF1080 domain-containing protein [Tannerellaceae bacterium]|jgi:hypothetical protein|nr:DUF1080 domain-containing protein [Tannerellaceae bacterium]
MYKIIFIWTSLSLFAMTGAAQINTLTEKEEQQGWRLLFNGKNLEGWTSVGKDVPPSVGWTTEDGVLTVGKAGDTRGGDVMTQEQFADFELKVDFRVTPGANSGIKYFFVRYEKGGWLGLEYQLIDNETHPDAQLGRDENRRQAGLYDMFAPEKDKEKPVGEWNEAHIVAKGTHVTHYLNGERVLFFDRKSPAYREACKLSKYKGSVPSFGDIKQGHILLQDHGDVVSFRNIKIRVIK